MSAKDRRKKASLRENRKARRLERYADVAEMVLLDAMRSNPAVAEIINEGLKSIALTGEAILDVERLRLAIGDE